MSSGSDFAASSSSDGDEESSVAEAKPGKASTLF